MKKKDQIILLGCVVLFLGSVFAAFTIFGDSAFFRLFERELPPPEPEFALPVPLEPVEQASLKVALSMVEAEFEAKRAAKKAQ